MVFPLLAGWLLWKKMTTTPSLWSTLIPHKMDFDLNLYPEAKAMKAKSWFNSCGFCNNKRGFESFFFNWIREISFSFIPSYSIPKSWFSKTVFKGSGFDASRRQDLPSPCFHQSNHVRHRVPFYLNQRCGESEPMALTKTNATANIILSHSISYNIHNPKGDNTLFRDNSS